jgi:hypothetical protein
LWLGGGWGGGGRRGVVWLAFGWGGGEGGGGWGRDWSYCVVCVRPFRLVLVGHKPRIVREGRARFPLLYNTSPPTYTHRRCRSPHHTSNPHAHHAHHTIPSLPPSLHLTPHHTIPFPSLPQVPSVLRAVRGQGAEDGGPPDGPPRRHDRGKLRVSDRQAGRHTPQDSEWACTRSDPKIETGPYLCNMHKHIHSLTQHPPP